MRSRAATWAMALAITGIVAGVVLVASMHLLNAMPVQVQTWMLPVFDAPVVPFVGVPVVLSAGWVMLALWHLGHKRWVLAGVVAALIGLAVAATAGFAPLSGMSTEFASALGVLEALVAGVLVADQFGYIKSQGILIGLAADIWVLMGLLVLFQGSLLLSPALSVAMGMIVASPVMAVAFTSYVMLLSQAQKQRGDGRIAPAREVTEAAQGRRSSLAWLVVALIALPLGLAVSYLFLSTLFPF